MKANSAGDWSEISSGKIGIIRTGTDQRAIRKIYWKGSETRAEDNILLWYSLEISAKAKSMHNPYENTQ